jgi:hypothetical protein
VTTVGAVVGDDSGLVTGVGNVQDRNCELDVPEQQKTHTQTTKEASFTDPCI